MNLLCKISLNTSLLCVLSLSVLSLMFSTTPAATQTSSVPNLSSDDGYLTHPLPPGDEKYATISGGRMKGYVRELTAISRNYRDAGHQYWGRLIGTSADVKTAEWMAAKLKEVGASNVRLQPLELPPQWMPQSWEAVVSGQGRSVNLGSAWPTYGTPGTPPGGLDMEVVYLGWGTEADFAGRDVRGKAAVIYSMPKPGPMVHSATLNGALRRAGERGAAAILVVIELPGNLRTALYPTRTEVPTFSLGQADGAAIRELVEAAPAGEPPHIRLRFEVVIESGLRTASVWGEIPGTSDERIMVIAHRDGFFEGASDNASGVATVVELAEFFARIPPQDRGRTITIIGTPGHHNEGQAAMDWLIENRETAFRNVTFLLNVEHTAHANVLQWGANLEPTNTMEPFRWGVHGSPVLVEIVDRALDAYRIPRWARMPNPGPAGETRPIQRFVPSFGLIYAGTLIHSDAETAETIPEVGIEAVTRSYARIIDEVDRHSLDALQP